MKNADIKNWNKLISGTKFFDKNHLNKFDFKPIPYNGEQYDEYSVFTYLQPIKEEKHILSFNINLCYAFPKNNLIVSMDVLCFFKTHFEKGFIVPGLPINDEMIFYLLPLYKMAIEYMYGEFYRNREKYSDTKSLLPEHHIDEFHISTLKKGGFSQKPMLN